MKTPTTPMLTLSPEKLTYWREEIRKARQKRKDISEHWDWDGNLTRYEPHARKTETGSASEDINTQIDFSDVQRKQAALLFDTPEVALITMIPGAEGIVLRHQRLLNGLLGPRHADIKPVANGAVFNCLCPAGVGPAVVGYHCTKQPIEADVPVLDPLTQMPAIDPLTGAIKTEKQTIDVPIAEKFFVSTVSPKALLLPADLRTTQYQQHAPWIGHDWEKPVSQVRREYKLPKDWKPTAGGSEADKPYFHGDDQRTEESGDPKVCGVTIWLRAELDMPEGSVAHPDRIRELVLVDGAEEPLVYRDSEHQTQIAEGPDAGRLTPDSLIGFNMRPLVLRDLSDSAWVPSDCAFTAQLTKEQNKYRSLALQKRDANVKSMITLYDATAFSPDTLAKIENGTTGTRVPVKDGTLAQGIDAVMAQVARLDQGRETYLDQDLIKADRGKILGMEDNQSGLRSRKGQTATEANIVQRNTEARFQQEANRVAEWFLDVVRAFDALVVRYADQRLATQILGPQDGAAWWQAKQQGVLAGSYTYDIKLDSARYVDIEAERAFQLKVYNLTGKDPNVRRTETLKKIAPLLGHDPNTWVVEQLPDPGPEPPKVTVSISADQLNPALPQFPIVLEVLRMGGYPISAQAVTLAQQQAKTLTESGRDPQTGAVLNEPIETMISAGTQMPVSGASADPKQAKQPPPHGGAQPPGDLINQHEADMTNQRSGPRVN